MNKNKCSQKNKVNENVCRIFLKKGKKKKIKRRKKKSGTMLNGNGELQYKQKS